MAYSWEQRQTRVGSFGRGELVVRIFETMAENIHDRFFKDNFSQRDIAVAFIEELFPPELSEKLDLSTFTMTNNSYIDPALDEYFADIVYSCQYGESQLIQIAILFEHKSYKEKYPHFQLMRYLVNSWEEAQKQKKPPVLVIPVVIYHGETRWRYEPLGSYFGNVPADLLRFMPEFAYLLYDISHYTDDALLGFRNKFLATSLFLMKHRENEQQLLAQKGNLFVWLDAYLNTEKGTRYIDSTVIYLSKNLDFRPRLFFQELFANTKTGKKAMSTYDQMIAEGHEIGMEQGLKQGLKQGAEEAFAKLLRVAHKQGIDITLLANQYDDLPKETIERIVQQIREETA